MFETMRRVFGPVAVAVIIGAIALVFVFYGVFSPKIPGMRGGGSSAATVNGENISARDFYREYQQRVELYQAMMKGQADLKMLQQLGLKHQVLDSLIQRKLMLQEATRLGVVVSDSEVRSRIETMPYFKKDGKFDADYYQKLLTANHLSPAKFEDSVREDLVRERLQLLFRDGIRASALEAKQDFLLTSDQREFNYVILPKGYKNVASAVESVKKGNIKELKKEKIETKNSGKFDASRTTLAGITPKFDASQVIHDTFAGSSKDIMTYKSLGGADNEKETLIVYGLKSYKADLSKFEKDKEAIIKRLTSQKQQAVFEKWLADAKTKSKIYINKDIEKEEE
ncbi:MAG: SurA N-terminal domain-containing protein [Bacteriovoracia bacterium]